MVLNVQTVCQHYPLEPEDLALTEEIRDLFLDILPSPALPFHDHIKSGNTEPPVRSTIKLSAWSLRLSYYLCTRRQGFAGIQSRCVHETEERARQDVKKRSGILRYADYAPLGNYD